MTKNKYIVLNPVSGTKNSGGIAVFSQNEASTKLYISLFGIEDSNFEILVDDLVFVRQFTFNHRIGEVEIEKNIEDFTDIVIGVFLKNELIFIGSSIGIETCEQRQRLEMALEKKYSLKHFGALAKKAICKMKNRTFFDEIAMILLDLFAVGIPDPDLEKIIKNSRWVKIFFESDVVTVGVVENDGCVSAVGLAYPVIDKNDRRQEIDSAFCFCPLTNTNPNGFGYYIVLQSAKDGSVVPIKSEKC